MLPSRDGYAANPYPSQLYDLRTDPTERRNLYAEQPEKVAELTTLLKQLDRDGRSRVPKR